MIKDDRQYQVARKLLGEFQASLVLLEHGRDPNTPEWLYAEQLKTVSSEIKALEVQIDEFQKLRN